MTERITDLMTANMMLGDLNRSLNKLSNTQEQLSTGKKLNKPSDDPYGASLAINLDGQLSSLSSYGTNVNDGTAWTQTADSSLTNMNNMMQRVRELLVGASNGTNSQSGLSASADEVDQLIAAVKQEANTQYDGQYVFAGSATTVPPYLTGATDTYQGNTSAVNRLIGPGVTLQVNTDLSQVLGSGHTAGDGKLLDVLRTISSDLRSGNRSALSSTDLTNLDTNVSQLQQTQAIVGATENRLQLASSRISSIQDSVTQQLSNVQDVDMSQAAINYSTEQAAYNAALQAGAKIVQSSLVSFLG